MIELRWLEYTASYFETNGGYELRKKLQYRTWVNEQRPTGFTIDGKYWTDWIDVPTVELVK